jgi:hypothetical protein
MNVRSLWVVLAVVVLATGCGGDGDGDESAPTRPQTTTTTPTTTTVEKRCPARLIWNQAEYRGNSARLPARIGEPLGRATIPACGQEPREQLPIARIPGVDPGVAVVEAEDAFDIWVAEAASAAAYPPALERILFGVSCEERHPFTLTGTWTGASNTSDPLVVRLDTDSTVPRPAYRGVELDLVVQDSTQGLNTRDAFSELDAGETRLRIRVRCVEADRPDRTFVAESVTASTAGG